MHRAIHCLFQFLIGRLKTLRNFKGIRNFELVSIPYKQTKNREIENIEVSEIREFQFLIGRLKTGSYKEVHKKISPVSIPYRQTKNGDI